MQTNDTVFRLSVVVKEVLKSPSKGNVPDSLVLDVDRRAAPQKEVKAASAWLAFFKTDNFQPSVLIPGIEFKCALVPADAEIVSAARRGIQRSRLSTDYFGYMP
jgi:hypothetical protein